MNSVFWLSVLGGVSIAMAAYWGACLIASAILREHHVELEGKEYEQLE